MLAKAAGLNIGSRPAAVERHQATSASGAEDPAFSVAKTGVGCPNARGTFLFRPSMLSPACPEMRRGHVGIRQILQAIPRLPHDASTVYLQRN